MDGTLFEELRQDADSKELQVRVAATIASAAATYMVERIKTASKGAGQVFIGLMEPYSQHFQFYAGLSDDLDKRSDARKEMCPYETQVNVDFHNVNLFKVIAAELTDPNFEVRKSPLLPAHETQKSLSVDKLHTALHLLELAAASYHNTHPVGHMIGPMVGIVLGAFERRVHVDKPDAFSDTSRFLSQLEDIDKHLRKIAVGVYRVPDFWPKFNDLKAQREHRKLPDAARITACSPLPVDEAERLVSDKLEGIARKKLSAPTQ